MTKAKSHKLKQDFCFRIMLSNLPPIFTNRDAMLPCGASEGRGRKNMIISWVRSPKIKVAVKMFILWSAGQRWRTPLLQIKFRFQKLSCIS